MKLEYKDPLPSNLPFSNFVILVCRVAMGTVYFDSIFESYREDEERFICMLDTDT